MCELKTAISQLNRALRAINASAVALSASSLARREQALKTISQVIALLTDVQTMIYQVQPDLEYHYDPSRTPTLFMQEVKKLVSEADAMASKGDMVKAIELLEKARAMEPPPLTYEILTKKISECGGK